MKHLLFLTLGGIATLGFFASGCGEDATPAAPIPAPAPAPSQGADPAPGGEGTLERVEEIAAVATHSFALFTCAASGESAYQSHLYDVPEDDLDYKLVYAGQYCCLESQDLADNLRGVSDYDSESTKFPRRTRPRGSANFPILAVDDTQNAVPNVPNATVDGVQYTKWHLGPNDRYRFPCNLGYIEQSGSEAKTIESNCKYISAALHGGETTDVYFMYRHTYSNGTVGNWSAAGIDESAITSVRCND